MVPLEVLIEIFFCPDFSDKATSFKLSAVSGRDNEGIEQLRWLLAYRICLLKCISFVL